MDAADWDITSVDGQAGTDHTNLHYVAVDDASLRQTWATN